MLKKHFRTVLIAAAFALLSGCAPTKTTQSTGQYLDDATITSKVKVALIRNKQTSAKRVHVTTYKGVVQLSGFAKNRHEINAAAKTARSVRGVKNVINNIQLRY